MKIFKNLILLSLIVLVGCSGQKEERFNYTLIKSKLDLAADQISQFDELTAKFGATARAAYEANRPDRQKVMEAVGKVFVEQDEAIKAILSAEQFEIYAAEIKIERDGREKHNMQLIKTELVLDSTQSAQYDLANQAFYKTLIDNHDNYHGKPDVYLQYYRELDVSRKSAFEDFMSSDQYVQYLELADQFNIGKSEH